MRHRRLLRRNAAPGEHRIKRKEKMTLRRLRNEKKNRSTSSIFLSRTPSIKTMISASVNSNINFFNAMSFAADCKFRNTYNVCYTQLSMLDFLIWIMNVTGSTSHIRLPARVSTNMSIELDLDRDYIFLLIEPHKCDRSLNEIISVGIRRSVYLFHRRC